MARNFTLKKPCPMAKCWSRNSLSFEQLQIEGNASFMLSHSILQCHFIFFKLSLNVHMWGLGISMTMDVNSVTFFCSMVETLLMKWTTQEKGICNCEKGLLSLCYLKTLYFPFRSTHMRSLCLFRSTKDKLPCCGMFRNNGKQ